MNLKDANGFLLGKEIVDFEVQIGDDVVGLIFFPCQVLVCILEIYPCGIQK